MRTVFSLGDFRRWLAWVLLRLNFPSISVVLRICSNLREENTFLSMAMAQDCSTVTGSYLRALAIMPLQVL